MRKYLLSFSFLTVLFFGAFFNLNSVSASPVTTGEPEVEAQVKVNEDIGIFAEIGPTYPGTNIKMQVGDILYSSKSNESTYFVGHVGIVGSDYKIYHVTPARNGGAASDMTSYVRLHKSGEKLSIYTPRDGRGVKAAAWAKSNYSRATKYLINPLDKLSVMTPNYCSKFLWQAFYYGENFDMLR
ncbi:hypothetical protein Q0F98_40755 [Paenibacillus amylolyticus]|nr:hypothetical protein Q0F98_40755 [Paenibacillus amylolyticus]